MMMLCKGLWLLHRGGKVWADETTFVPFADFVAAGFNPHAIVWKEGRL